jgi:uncharacterized protein with von Willebrand factor type A (vWA) domain
VSAPDGPGAAAGFDARVIELVEWLRHEGVAIGTSELLDALRAVGEVSWREPAPFRDALAATLAKSPEDQRIFAAVFEAFLTRAAAGQALRRGVREGEAGGRSGAETPSEEAVDVAELRRRLMEALLAGDDSALRDLARLAIAAFGRRGEHSGVLGVDVQRIRRELELTGTPRAGDEAGGGDDPQPSREQVRAFEAHLRRELERAQVERTGVLPPARPLTELDRSLPTGPLQDLAAVHRVVAQLRRRLATQGSELRTHGRHAHVDMRRTMRASLQTGGAPVILRYRPRQPRRPELYVLCDVSTSVSSASFFFLAVLHALHDVFRRMRSFVFVERISEVTGVFDRGDSFADIAQAISADAGVADVSGYTDYGRVWGEFATAVEEDLHARATVIVLGDARTNGRDPGIDAFRQVTARAGRTLWLNPEPRLYWDHGDSVIGAYAAHCEAHECWTAGHLEAFVQSLTRRRA